MSLFLVFAANGALAAAPAEPATPNTEIVITGSRVATTPDDVAANVTVLSREDFDVEKPRQLSDVLRRAAGVHVDQVGGRGGTGSLYLRGADPNYTLVLVDGVRVNDPTNARGGSFDFSTFDVADIERVEIARGPYSAVYGGDALAGVVNIVTRRAPPEKATASLDAMGGSYDVREIALDARGPVNVGIGAWSLGASDSREGEVVRGNHYDGQRVSGGVHTLLGHSTTVFVNGRYSESSREGFPDDSGGYEYSVIREPEARDADEAVFGAGIGIEGFEHAGFGLQLGYFDRNDHIDSPGVAPGIRDPFGVPPSVVDTSLTRSSATFTGTYRFSELLTLAYGVDWLREEGTSDGVLDFGGGFLLPTSFELTRTSWAPFAEARVATGHGLSLQAGVRVDKPDELSSVTSPRVRVEYEFADSGFSVAGAWGKAFKLPSLYALGHPIVGNPDLVPERGESYELEFAQSLLEGRARWSATWFDGEFRNAIDFDAGPPPMLVNRDRIDTRGVELAGRLAVSDEWQLDASVTNSKSRIAGTDDELRNRPDWRGGIGAHWSPVQSLRFSASATYVGSSLDSSIATGDLRLDSYTRFDVSASWRASEKLEAYLAIDNLTDQEYEQFVGNEARGILPRAGVRFSL
jgi:outer membrane cobalamin receptor